jgi:hypothetical protein
MSHKKLNPETFKKYNMELALSDGEKTDHPKGRESRSQKAQNEGNPKITKKTHNREK